MDEVEVRTAAEQRPPAVDPLVRLRARLVLGMVAVLLLCLAGRLFHIQVLQHEHYRELALKQHRTRLTVRAPRGDIYSSDGQILARSVLVNGVVAVPTAIFKEEADPAQVLGKVAEVLAKDQAWVDARVAEVRAKANKHFVWLARAVRPEVYRQLKALDLPGVRFEVEERHVYPMGRLAAQVLGFCDADNDGIEGIEKTLDPWLSGRDGWRETSVDAHGRHLALETASFEAPSAGLSVVLTIDSFIQAHVESVLDRLVEERKPKSACAVVLDPRDGRVLAMASWPGFDPNDRGAVPEEQLRNRAIIDVFEPGSTMKPFVVAGALQAGVVKPDTKFHCRNGTANIGSIMKQLVPQMKPIKRILTDGDEGHGYGLLPVWDIVVHSSNIGMAQIGLVLGSDRTYNTLRLFGFGSKTGIELYGESAGLLPALKSWSAYTLTSVPMGHEVATSAMQLAVAYGGLAHPQGVVHSARLVERLVDADGRTVWQAQSRIVGKPINAKTRALVAGMLGDVVERGTAKKARLEEFKVAGKTGTTRKIDPATNQYSNKLHVATFCAFAPAELPECVVVVSVDEPKGESYGGLVAAPAVKEILRESVPYLRSRRVAAAAAAGRGPR